MAKAVATRLKLKPNQHKHMRVIVTELQSDQGSLVVFAGTAQESGDPVMFACDHRYAQDLVEALENGDSPSAHVESWQLL